MKASSHCTIALNPRAVRRVCSLLPDLVHQSTPQRIVVDVLHAGEWKTQPTDKLHRGLEFLRNLDHLLQPL